MLGEAIEEGGRDARQLTLLLPAQPGQQGTTQTGDVVTLPQRRQGDGGAT